ncbi:MAG: RsmB/NOP family class I SAM-dependent RNA methyltransferase [Pseudomonadota bacterium]
MTPQARVASAIEILDEWMSGQPAEQALTRWARRSRFAGSKDRAAIRDLVFEAIRVKESAETLGGGTDGRAVMIGLLRYRGDDPKQFFSGERFAPAPLDAHETKLLDSPVPEFHWNLPEWLVVRFQTEFGEDAQHIALALAARAPVTLRVNARKAGRTVAQNALAQEGILTRENALAPYALTVTDGARRVRQSLPYQTGIVEIQDASSQAVVELLPQARRCLDYCAGGGGKALALAAQPNRHVTAHDSDMARMADIAPRAARAGVEIEQQGTRGLAGAPAFDLVFCDVPCSGSGAWRRSPDAKWRLTKDRLAELRVVQQGILARAVPLVHPSGWLVYATCSVLPEENENVIATFLDQNPQWVCSLQRRYAIGVDGDGFFTAHLQRRTVQAS